MNSLTLIGIVILAILGLGWFWARSTRNRPAVYGQAGENAHSSGPQPVGAGQTAEEQQKPQHKHGGCC